MHTVLVAYDMFVPQLKAASPECFSCFSHNLLPWEVSGSRQVIGGGREWETDLLWRGGGGGGGGGWREFMCPSFI